MYERTNKIGFIKYKGEIMIKRYGVYSVGMRATVNGKKISNAVEILDYKRACNLLNEMVITWKSQGQNLDGFNVWIETKQVERLYHSEQYEV